MSATFENNTVTWCDDHAIERASCGCVLLDPAESQHRGQARIAYRLAGAYTGRLLFVHGVGWHAWDGKRWTEDTTGAAKRAVLDVLRQALSDSLGDQDLRSDVRKCETSAGVAGVLDLASALEPFAAGVDDLDADPWLLNVANGTLDLRTMILRPHDPSDRITKLTRGGYDPQASAPAWDQFLATVLPDPEVRGYLQRLAGLALLGKVEEHLFPVATGTGANGKGTSYTALLHMFGDYGHAAESDLFMQAKANPNAASPALMRLRGVRFVVVSETEEGHRLAAALMKNLTGGDPITARPLYGKPVTFDPSHTSLMVTNHLPKVSGDDPAIWRRIRVLPFDVVIPEGERDGKLPDRLKLEADGILAWAIRGYREYEDRGMDAPPAVTVATDRYHHDSDAVAQFIDYCHTGPQFTATTTQLHNAFQDWARGEGIAVDMGRKQFGESLDKRGFPAGQRRMRKGIGVPFETEDEA